jgi:hypothetical protein
MAAAGILAAAGNYRKAMLTGAGLFSRLIALSSLCRVSSIELARLTIDSMNILATSTRFAVTDIVVLGTKHVKMKTGFYSVCIPPSVTTSKAPA